MVVLRTRRTAYSWLLLLRPKDVFWEREEFTPSLVPLLQNISMPTDPSIIAAIAAAVESAPDSAPLRLHFASLLLGDGRPQEALAQCTAILAREPDHREALRKAAEAAFQSGDTVKAVSYGRLLDALGADLLSDLDTPPAPPRLPVESLRGGGGISPPPTANDRTAISVSAEDEDGPGTWEPERPSITLQDVAGMETVKRRLNIAFLAPMQNPDLRKLYGKSLKGGLLLYGPPGCGKTFIARATAGELGAKFLSVGLSDVLDMWLGQSEKNLHEIFETARRSRPCVLFFDEIDALGRKRSLMRQSAGRDVVNQLLAEMDSVGADNEGVFILAATNHPWDIDAALRRPGRLDRTLLVLPPDAPARESILRLNSEDRPLAGVDFAQIAAKTEDYSGADLAHLCDSAAELALEDSLTSGKVRPISGGDFKQALKDVRPSVRPWFETARNYALYSNEGGLYDDLLDYMRSRRIL